MCLCVRALHPHFSTDFNQILCEGSLGPWVGSKLCLVYVTKQEVTSRGKKLHFLPQMQAWHPNRFTDRHQTWHIGTETAWELFEQTGYDITKQEVTSQG